MLAQPLEASNLSNATSALNSWQRWGPYRPNLYFGVRPLVPETLLMGLMWASGDSQSRLLGTVRDTCEQDDGMQGYGWSFYDTRFGGSQTIHDTKLEVDIDTDFIKSDDGNSWAVRITGTPRANAVNVKTSVILHFALEEAGSDGSKTLSCHDTAMDQDEAVAVCQGDVHGLGNFEMQVLGDANNKRLHDPAVRSLRVPEDKIWQAKGAFAAEGNIIDRQLTLNNNADMFVREIKSSGGGNIFLGNKPGEGNMHFIQLGFEGSFSVVFTYHTVGTASLDCKSREHQ